MKRKIVAVFSIVIWIWPAVAQDYSGVPHVVDGNTIIINYQRIRLHGIKAPDAGQTCGLDDKILLCGREATNALANIVGRHWVTCRKHRLTEFGNVDATCFAGEVLNLNAWMVRNGWATAQNQSNPELLQLETLARQERMGIWNKRTRILTERN